MADEQPSATGEAQPELEAQPAASAVPLEPPSDAVAITDDGGVLKLVVEPGRGELPVRHARCLVHYVGRCVPSGEVFMSTKDESAREEPLVIVAGRDVSTRETGLNLAVASMRPGERAWVYVTDPAYGYGDKGSFSFPSVPPSCKLVYDVQMLTWEPPAEDRDRRSMVYEERLEAAERRRLEGNELFAAGEWLQALGKYAMALSYCDEDFMLQLQGAHLDKAEAVTNPIFLNMAAAQLKLGDYATAAHNCTQVLVRDEKHVKALFRRAKARAAMGRNGEALEDLTLAASVDPEDKQIPREIAALKRTIKEEQAASASLFRGSLGPPPKPKPGAAAPAAAGAAAGADAGTSNGAGSRSSRPRAAASSGLAGSASGSSGLLGLLAGLLAWLGGLLARLLGVKRGVAVAQR